MQESDLHVITTRSARGVIALISRAFFLNILSYLASLIVFTYLNPKEVGAYILVTAIQRVVSFFTDFGFGAALIQKREDLTQDDLTTTFTLQATVSLVVLAIVIVFGRFISSYFSLDTVAMQLLYALIFTIFLSSFKVIPSILLERNIHFQKLIIPQVVESFVFNLVLIVLVLKGLGLKSYTLAFLISGVISIPFYYSTSPWKIHFGIRRDSLKHLHYGLQFQAKNILATVKDDLLMLLLGKILTLSQLGYIGFGQRNAFFAYRYIVDSVTKVTFSTYSRLQEHKEYLTKSIEKSLFFVSFFMFPISVGIILIAPYVVEFFPKWHNKWEPALVSLAFFSLNALVSSMSGILINVLDATGKVKLTLKLMMVWTVSIWVLSLLLIKFIGYNGVSIASFLVTLTIGITIYLVKRHVDFDFFKCIRKPLFATIVMTVFTYFLTRIIVANLFSLIVSVVLSAALYSFIMFLLARKELEQGISFLFTKHE